MRTRNILYFQEKIGFHPFILKSKRKNVLFLRKSFQLKTKMNLLKTSRFQACVQFWPPQNLFKYKNFGM